MEKITLLPKLLSTTVIILALVILIHQLPAYAYGSSTVDPTTYLPAGTATNITGLNSTANPDFTFFDNKSEVISYGLPSFWNDTEGNCVDLFQCTSNRTSGWQDSTSLQISTMSNINNTWSWIYSKKINVKPGEQYELVTHMKLNQYATQSHLAVEAYNETSKSWN